MKTRVDKARTSAAVFSRIGQDPQDLATSASLKQMSALLTSVARAGVVSELDAGASQDLVIRRDAQFAVLLQHWDSPSLKPIRLLPQQFGRDAQQCSVEGERAMGIFVQPVVELVDIGGVERPNCVT